MGDKQSTNRVQAALAIGGNLGDVERTFKRALAKLNRSPDLTVLRRSDWMANPAVGGPEGQPEYLNGALTVETILDPQELLALCLNIEGESGRERETGERNLARPLDLDVLLYGSQTIDSPGLTIPHPRMLQRTFVLEPLAQIAPDWAIPGSGMSVQKALDALRGVSAN